MEWNMKWDWENMVMFSSKPSEGHNKLQMTDWVVEEEGEVDTGSFNLSGGGGGGGGGSGGYGSDLGHGSSAKSSISASTDSSSKDGKPSSFKYKSFRGSPGDFNMKEPREIARAELSGTSPSLEASAGSSEPLIGLKLGKRTYFENNSAVNTVKNAPPSATPASSATSLKKTKSSCQSAPIPRCQVEGCNLDLSSAKDYHKKHRVCDEHSKSPRVMVAGLERRFCQQCSRFHSLSEFDEKKRSCRRRLSDHNARRRKPQQETIQFNSARLSSSLYDGRQEMSFVLNHVPPHNSRSAANLTWESTCSSKFTVTTAYPRKQEKTGGVNGQTHVAGIQLPHGISLHDLPNGHMASKGSAAEVFNQGFKSSMFSSNIDAAPEIPRALSLLSNDFWGSCEPVPVVNEHSMRVNQTKLDPVMHALPQSLPLASSEYWETDLHSTGNRIHALGAANNNGNHFQEIQLVRTPYETDFYFNALDP